jgi:hypothetical protein
VKEDEASAESKDEGKKKPRSTKKKAEPKEE